MSKIILIYVPNPTKREAEKIAKSLLLKKLIACANILEATSLYWWEGKIRKTKEFILVGKTVEEKIKIIDKEIEKLHAYEVPAILKIRSTVNKKFFSWLKKEIA